MWLYLHPHPPTNILTHTHTLAFAHLSHYENKVHYHRDSSLLRLKSAHSGHTHTRTPPQIGLHQLPDKLENMWVCACTSVSRNWTLELYITSSLSLTLLVVLYILHLACIVAFLFPLCLPVFDTYIFFIQVFLPPSFSLSLCVCVFICQQQINWIQALWTQGYIYSVIFWMSDKRCWCMKTHTRFHTHKWLFISHLRKWWTITRG